jgi:RNA polymerase sigma-32 factor
MSMIDTMSAQRADRRFVQGAMAAPMLAREHELELARRWRENNDQAALHELVTSYLRLVVATAGRYRNYGLPMPDLVQEGMVGLMQAAARFEPERDVRFSTYAAWWIRSAMQDFVLRNWSIVRTGTTAAQKSLFFNLRRLRARIDGGRKQQLDDDDRAAIAQELDVGIADVVAMEHRLSASDQSLNAPVGLEGESVGQDFIADERPNPEEALADGHDSRTRTRWIASSLATLSEREQIIIRERRLREEGSTLEELGRKLGISKERVRQIEHRALQKLKNALLQRVKDPADEAILVGAFA